MNKWIVLSFVIPEVLVLGFIVMMSPMVAAFGGATTLPGYYLYGSICALVPGTMLCGLILIHKMLASKPDASS